MSKQIKHTRISCNGKLFAAGKRDNAVHFGLKLVSVSPSGGDSDISGAVVTPDLTVKYPKGVFNMIKQNGFKELKYDKEFADKIYDSGRHDNTYNASSPIDSDVNYAILDNFLVAKEHLGGDVRGNYTENRIFVHPKGGDSMFYDLHGVLYPEIWIRVTFTDAAGTRDYDYVYNGDVLDQTDSSNPELNDIAPDHDGYGWVTEQLRNKRR